MTRHYSPRARPSGSLTSGCRNRRPGPRSPTRWSACARDSPTSTATTGPASRCSPSSTATPTPCRHPCGRSASKRSTAGPGRCCSPSPEAAQPRCGPPSGMQRGSTPGGRCALSKSDRTAVELMVGMVAVAQGQLGRSAGPGGPGSHPDRAHRAVLSPLARGAPVRGPPGLPSDPAAAGPALSRPVGAPAGSGVSAPRPRRAA